MNWHALIDLSLWFAFSWRIMILIIYLIVPQSFLFHLLKILSVFMHTMSIDLFMFWESSFVFFIYFRYGVLDIWMLTIFSHSLTWCFSQLIISFTIKNVCFMWFHLLNVGLRAVLQASLKVFFLGQWGQACSILSFLSYLGFVVLFEIFDPFGIEFYQGKKYWSMHILLHLAI